MSYNRVQQLNLNKTIIIMEVRNLSIIANDIITDFKREFNEAMSEGKKAKHWRIKYVHALAYVEPMQCLNSINEDYGMDSGRSVVAYALGNLTTWRGDKAREIKKELNGMLK
jgi:hypothetical protein